MASRRFYDGAQAEIGSTQTDLGGFVTPAAPVAATSTIPQPTGWYLTVTDTFTVNDIYDDAGWDAVNGLRLTENYMAVGDHLGTNDGYGSWRFNIPAGINVDSISDVRMRPMAKQTGSVAGIFRVEQSSAAAFNYDFAQRPDQRWGAIGSTGEQPTGPVAGTADTRFSATDFPNLAPRVRDALRAMGGSGYLGIHLGGAGNTGNYVWQMWAYDSTGGWTKSPQLEITHVIVTQPYVQPTPVAATSTIPGPLLYERVNDISYDSAPSGYSERRIVDVYLPMGTAPAGGWPVAMFVHGGGFYAGDEDDITGTAGYRYRHDTIGNGFAVTSISYKLTHFDFDVNNGWTRPHPQQDMVAFLKWLGTQSTYDLDSTKIIGTAYSAGAHLMLEAACFVEDPNIDTYEASSSGMAPGANPGVPDITGTGPAGDRYNDFPTLDITQGRTNIPRLIGVFTFGGPVSLSKIWDDSLILDGVINLYFGHRPSTGFVKGAVNEEGDIDAFITGLAGSIYDSTTTARVPAPPQFPIGLMYTTNDTTVPVSSGYTALRAALNTVGYKVDTDTDKQVNPGVALSRYSYTGTGDSAGGHDTIMVQYDRTFFVEWLKNTLALTLPDSVDAISTVPTPAAGGAWTPDVVAVTSTVPTPAWSEESVATGGTATPDAVTATSTVPAAGWVSNPVPTVVTATSTAPDPARGAGWLLSVVTSTSTVPVPTLGAGIAPTTVAATSTIPAPGWRSAPTLATVSAIATIPTAGWVGTTTATAVAAVATTPGLTWGAGWVPAAVTAITAIAAQAGVGGGYTTPATVGAGSTAPAPAWGAGWVLASVTATSTIPAPSALGGGAAQVATVTGTSTTPVPVWGAGWVLTGPAATSTVPEASFASGGTVTPTTITATSTTPTPAWGAGWLLTSVTALAAVPAAAWVGRSTVSTVSATSTVPAPGWVGRSTVAAVATTTTTTTIAWGAGWVLTGPSTTTTIAAQAGVGGGYTTPATVGASTAMATTTWGAGWVLTGPTSISFIGSPDTAGGMTAYPTRVAATSTVPGPAWGTGWIITGVQSTTSVPAAGWGTARTPVAVGATTTIPGVSLTADTVITPATTAAVAGQPALTWGAGWQLAPASAPAAVGSIGWGSGWTQDRATCITEVPDPTLVYGSTTMVAAVAVLVYIGLVSGTGRSPISIVGSHGDGLRRQFRHPGGDDRWT